MNPEPTASVFRRKSDGTLLILRFGISKKSGFVVGMGRFIEVPAHCIEIEGGREIIKALDSFSRVEGGARCELQDMTPERRRKFHRAHDELMLWKDEVEDVLHVTPMVPKGSGARGNPRRKKILRGPYSASEVIDAVLAVMGPLDPPKKAKKK